MVFRYDAALDLVFKEEFTEQPADQEGEENAQQQPQPQPQQEAVMNEPRRKRPRYGNYELLFPESEEQEQEQEQEREREPEEPDEEEEELQTSCRGRKTSTLAAPEQLPFNHPAIKKEKGRSTNHGDNWAPSRSIIFLLFLSFHEPATSNDPLVLVETAEDKSLDKHTHWRHRS